MSYDLQFLPPALEEWRKLPEPIRAQLKKKLAERLDNPRVPKDRLHGAQDRYKIKLRALGYRLVYQVDDTAVTVTVIAAGRRDKNLVYRLAESR
jgi:mRNA interferase RelE/StbE